jgi:putative oxidoreductase
MTKSTHSSLILPVLGPVYAVLDEWMLPLLRFVAGFNMAMHGWVHINSEMAQTAAFFSGEGYEPGLFWAYAVTFTEFVGGICLAIGFLTRLAAIPIIIFLIVAVTYHMPNGFYWDARGFEYPLLWAVVAFVFLVKGGGRLSIDNLLGKSF